MTSRSRQCGACPIVVQASAPPAIRVQHPVVTTLKSWLATIGWWIREFSGETAYDKYVARHRIEHPDHEPMCARDFWRMRDAEAEHNVQAGCC